MADQLLVRAYNVGCGDCIYVRIPDGNDGFHILIDCGKKGGDELLKKAMAHLAGELPKRAGKSHLDLLVATHRHEDHIKGFDPEQFKNFDVKNIWLSVAMDPKHPQAKGVRALHAFATQEMEALAQNQTLGADVELLTAMYGVSNDVADELLMKTLPTITGVPARYVCSGMDHQLTLPPDTDLHILAPEKDIDGYYLGEDLDVTLKRVQGLSATFGLAAGGGVVGQAAPPNITPTNISPTDFRGLQSRMLSNGLAFAAKESSIQNNLSVVLLLEWKKRRLLFVGDAEWDGEYKKNKHNGSWNVMWEMHSKTHLSKPVDFLKIGHHGSINATPPPPSEQPKKNARADGVYTILDTILPVPKAGTKPTATAIVSTEREFYDPIPECKRLVDLARRVSNTRVYGDVLKKKKIAPTSLWTSTKAKKNRFFDKYEKDFLDQPQPQRTDLEFVTEGSAFIEVVIPPA
jgi:beta-lactamase superfamily II metal-dependent hydrolase